MKKVLLTLATILSANTVWAKTVTDSLVKNLPCDQITVSEIYRKIDTSQFSSQYHLPITNWNYDSGLYNLGNCWSLTHAQRLFFYLNRWNSLVAAKPADTKLQGLLNFLRGAKPYTQNEEKWILDGPLGRLQVFGAAESHFDKKSGLFAGLMTGVSQLFPNHKTEKRNFKSEIEHYQKNRFTKFLKNIKYVIGTGARSEQKNRETRDALIQNLEGNRLPMMILRTIRTTQHAVLAKHYEVLSNGDISFTVYDSNQPDKDQTITYKQADQNFYAPEVAKEFTDKKYGNDPLGVYIVDQDDFDPIDRALVEHYTALCNM